MRIQIVIVLAFALIAPSTAEPFQNDYGFANAWFNGQEATVKNLELKIGEPADIKLEVTSNISGHVFVALTNPLVTVPYQVVEGSDIEERIDNLNVPSGWSKTFAWKIKPNGAWTNGNAPINIFIKFYNLKSKESKIIEFTIANPYILDEQYTGAVPTPEPTSSPAETPAPGTPGKAAPFLSAVAVVGALLAVWWRRMG